MRWRPLPIDPQSRLFPDLLPWTSLLMTYYRTAIVDDLKIFYREAGDPSHPTLLLLHGFPASSFMYRDLIARLSHRFHLVAPDYPGFGHSDAPSTDAFSYTFDRLSEVIERFAEQLGLDRYGLYMQDFGGPVGLRIASRRPERVSFLVVQNANAYEEGLPDSFWGPVRELWRDPSPARYEKIREAGMSAAALEWNYTHGVRDVERIDPDSWLLQRALLERPGNKDAMLALLYDYGSNPGRYPAWQAYFRAHQPPTLVVWGKNDAIFPPSGAYPYQRDLKLVDFNVLETGHFALEDHGEVIAAHIERFHGTLSA
ncbi:alpha/beta fold hydrolase [Burkholderia paludis]|uniref:alpha/beta fold hydrolase n=1 Tax=Burkholderia paludis TaxID=1506587 RepID=UPI001F344CAB|nr:alpha/beta fold hydrolase [Burkholderia paludis]